MLYIRSSNQCRLNPGSNTQTMIEISQFLNTPTINQRSVCVQGSTVGFFVGANL